MGVQLLGVVLIFLSVGLTLQTGKHCNCVKRHPQDEYSSSKIVILADVTGKRLPVKNQHNLVRYKIKIIKVLKGSINAHKTQYVFTDSSSCGIKLAHGRYVLSAIQLNYGIKTMKCDIVKQWEHLSLTERENYSQTYKLGGNCTISTCSDSPCCPQSENECKWDANSPDALEYVCLRDSDNYCSWYWPASRVEEDEACLE
ncbi:metalloproteinase inhibitor 3-like [Triplophysa dalaica]|uniref:metalloproteinase inhibitor 3-like n=1 Tax=Triplophysa dalaica TaxID=1582913 RepID=UPI0024DF8062|nr:metalloproteinase inhibitor 3-like [Triplophysa dalaica]